MPRVNDDGWQLWYERQMEKDCLKRAGIDWTVRRVPLSSINWSLSEQNCGRFLEPVDLERVARISAYVKCCRKERLGGLPMGIIAETTGGLLVVAGFHRNRGAGHAGERHVTALVIACSAPHELRVLATETNAKEGVGLSINELYSYAIHDVMVSNIPSAKVAKLYCGINIKTLQDKVRARKLAKVAAEAGSVKAEGNLSGLVPDSTVRALGKLESSPAVLAAALDHAVGWKLPETDVAILCNSILKGKNEAEQLAFIKVDQDRLQAEKEAREKSGRKRTESTVTKLVKQYLSQLGKKLDGKETFEDIGISTGSEDARNLETLANDKVIEPLQRIFASNHSGHVGKVGAS